MAYITWLLCLALNLVYCQDDATVDPSILIDIFGTPPPTMPPVSTSTPRFEDITRRTTDSSTTFVDKTGESCKCVPYYLCSPDLVAVDANNVSVTGWGTLDIRFREDDCQESAERCCKDPKPIEEYTPPPPPMIRPCGYRNSKGLDFSITGGSGLEAQFGEFPWVIALMDSSNDSYIGVGVLIHPEVVMTGAHIASKFHPGGMKIRAGEWDTQTSKERLPYQERVVSDIHLHEDFNPKTLYNDIALLRLDSELQLAQHINTICLPEQDQSFDDGRKCIANGWGKDTFGLVGRYAVILKQVEQDMITHSRCSSLLKRTRLGPRFRLHDSFVCAGGEEGKDTCQGDGGAPLACPVGDDRYQLTGLVAWGIGCGQKDVPAVYTRVSMFRDWVDSQMSKWGYITSYNLTPL